ncbi:MAG TPA: hypothetical protein ENG58_01885 [Thermotogales bacterium]|nr:hypothetical protein [Thermotogales bacterium]
MKMIAFLTDWGNSHYVGIAKGVIKKISPNSEIVDITHHIKKFSARMAMHILERVVDDFPKNTVFLCVVDYGVGTERKPIAFETENELKFVGPDNGIFTLILKKHGLKNAVSLENEKYFYRNPPSDTFHGRDIFAPVAAHLDSGIGIEEFGRSLSSLKVLNVEEARIVGDRIEGEVAFTDHFGNIETNIPFDMVEVLMEGKTDKLKLEIPANGRSFELSVLKTYAYARRDEIILHRDSSGYVEIAMNMRSAEEYMDLHGGEKVVLKR